MFNALKYTQELEKAGFSRSEAEASVKLLIEVMNDNFATKSDLKETEFKLEAAIQKLTSSLKEIEYRMTIKLGTMLTIAIGVTATLVKVLQGLH